MSGSIELDLRHSQKKAFFLAEIRISVACQYQFTFERIVVGLSPSGTRTMVVQAIKRRHRPSHNRHRPDTNKFSFNFTSQNFLLHVPFLNS